MKLTVVMVGGINRSTRMISVPTGVIIALGAWLCLSVIAGFFCYFSFEGGRNLSITQKKLEAQCTVQENELSAKIAEIYAQKDRIEELDSGLKKIKSKLDRIFQMDARIRQYLGLDAREFNTPDGSHQGGIPPQLGDAVTETQVKWELHYPDIRSGDVLMAYAIFIQESTFELMNFVEKRDEKVRRIPSILPVRGNGIWLSSFFGYRKDPFTGQKALHNGLDIAGQYDIEIIAPADGTVEDDERDRFLGNVIKLDHGEGVKTIFGHLSRITVKKKDKIKRGQVIGYMGNSGRSTGTHLHYSITRSEMHFDPMDYIWDYSFENNRLNPYMVATDQ